jgi:hypothetical protein
MLFGHGQSIYTMEINKHCKSAFPPPPPHAFPENHLLNIYEHTTGVKVSLYLVKEVKAFQRHLNNFQRNWSCFCE